MKWNKQQKVLAGVMIAGLFAVGADRMTSHASSASAAVLADTAEIAIAKTPAAVIPATKSVSLAERLQAATAEPAAARGAFELSSVWEVSPTVVAPVIDPAIEVFSTTHKLSATLIRGDHAGAVIDGKLCVIGQVLDGFKLVSVTGRSATFASVRSRVTLTQMSR